MTIATTEATHGLTLSTEQDWWSDKQLAALRQIGVERATNGDLAVFMHVCQRTGLDPFARQIYMIERQGKQTIQTGIDGMRLVARRAVDRTGEALSISAPEWCDVNGQWTDVWLASEPPAAARVHVTRGTGSFSAVALWREYAQTKRDGALTAMWASRPAGQLAKCAEALALRKACPQDLSGIYSDDEMAREHREQPQRGLASVLQTSDPDPATANAAEAPDPTQSGEAEPSGSESARMLTNTTKFGRAFYARMGERKFATDQERIEYVVETIGRFIESTKEMTEDEARMVLARLDEEDAPVDGELVEGGESA